MEDRKKNYIAQISQDGSLKTIRYETDENPIGYIWNRYGMSTYIDSVEEEVTPKAEIELSTDLKVLEEDLTQEEEEEEEESNKLQE